MCKVIKNETYTLKISHQIELIELVKIKICLTAQYKSVPTGFKAAQNLKLFSPNYGKHFALLIYGIGQFICENAPSIECTSV